MRDLSSSTSTAGRVAAVRDLLREHYPGVAISGIIGVAAFALSVRYTAPAMLVALLVGLACHFLYEHERLRIGVDWVSRSLLRIGVALLGVRVVLGEVLSIGLGPIVVVVVAMSITIAGSALIAKSLSQSSEFGVLTGGAVAVCGVSAAIAISSVLPKRENADRELAATVAGVTTLSTVAMITYPLGNLLLHLTDREMGVVLGGSIHDVAQVVGAGYSVSHQAGDVATFVKLLRVSALLPIVLAIHHFFGRNQASLGAASPAFPMFLVAFFVLAATSSFGWAPRWLIDSCARASQWFLLISIAAIGIKTDLKGVLGIGWRPFALMAFQSALMLGVVLGGVLLLRLLR